MNTRVIAVLGLALGACVWIAAPMACGPAADSPAAEAPAPDSQATQTPGDAPQASGDAFFAERVLPILSQRCFKCHGPAAAKVKGGLRMSGRQALLAGGDSGPAIVPGDADASLLIRAVRYTDEELKMPPKEQRLPAAEVGVLERWVTVGAPWPAPAPAGAAKPAAPVAGTVAAAVPTADAAGAPGGLGTAAATPVADEPGGAAVPSADGDLGTHPTHDDLQFFEQEVRPILADNCFECHGPTLAKVKGGLRMTGRAAFLQGGDGGPALVPGSLKSSRMLRAVRYSDAELRMPPKHRLTEAQVKSLERWVAIGAPWPDEAGAPGAPAAPTGADSGVRRDIDLDAGRTWWSFQPVVRPKPPAVAGAATPIDAFILARLQGEGLQAAPLADRRTLARRAYFDLLGLPPTLEELQAFEHDEQPDAWERLVDGLLARPEYGERWGRHWLDLVRYAQTSGYERDEEKPLAWRYRDWVIDAFNADMPYDRFILEQLAGDELPDASPGSAIATGFYRLGVWDSEPDDDALADYDELDDTLRTISEGFMGLTVGCCRCHDHKFDPLPQEDYYSLLAFLRNVQPYSPPKYALDSPTLTPLDLDWRKATAWERGRRESIAALGREESRLRELGRQRALQKELANRPQLAAAQALPPEQRTPDQQRSLASLLEHKWTEGEIVGALEIEDARRLGKVMLDQEVVADSYPGDLDWALTVRELGGGPLPTRLLVRGKPSTPAQEVPLRFPRVLFPSDEAALVTDVTRPAGAASSGRRLALARWIASPSHPLTARVLVNRVWQHHFGRGLVATPNDFGHNGEAPSDPQLLDWLADEFVQDGWSIKRLQKLVMMSDAYRRSSVAGDEAAVAKDPANALLWRQNRRRLEAEPLRDSVLAVAGRLDPTRGGPSFYPDLEREVLAGLSRPGEGWGPVHADQEDRRSIYAYVKRNLTDPLAEAFDRPNPSLPIAVRPVTTVPSQALVLLNSGFMARGARSFAARVAAEAGDDPTARVRRAFALALDRAPTADEERIALDYLQRATADFAPVAPVLTFEARLPERADLYYLAKLAGEDVLAGPREGWLYLKGRWGDQYNNTLAPDPLEGPAALWTQAVFQDGELTARLRLRGGSHFGSVLLRAQPQKEALTGLEVRLDADPPRLRLVEHDGQSAKVVAEAEAAVGDGAWHELTITARGPAVSVTLDGGSAPVLVAPQAAVTQAGRIGLATWGEGLELARLVVRSGADETVLEAPAQRPQDRALEALALLVLNLNEFVYVD
jgi:hypothetical protein